MEDIDRYWQAVTERVCKECVDGDGAGGCLLRQSESCGLRMHFPQLVQTVLSVQSDSLQPYIDALKSDICASCTNQTADGTCVLRSQLDCGLDRYFVMVVQAIEEADGILDQ